MSQTLPAKANSFPWTLEPIPTFFLWHLLHQLYDTWLFSQPSLSLFVKAFLLQHRNQCKAYLSHIFKTQMKTPVLISSVPSNDHLTTFSSPQRSPKENPEFILVSSFLPHQCFLLPACRVSHLPNSLYIAAFDPNNRHLDGASSFGPHGTVLSWFYSWLRNDCFSGSPFSLSTCRYSTGFLPWSLFSPVL